MSLQLQATIKNPEFVIILRYSQKIFPCISPNIRELRMILNPAVGQGRVYSFWGAEQGAMTWNGCSIPGSCNAAMCRKNCALCPDLGLLDLTFTHKLHGTTSLWTDLVG